jgi:hypothetical protein
MLSAAPGGAAKSWLRVAAAESMPPTPKAVRTKAFVTFSEDPKNRMQVSRAAVGKSPHAKSSQLGRQDSATDSVTNKLPHAE